MYTSHNSLTYAKPAKFWQRIFNPFSKCQKCDIAKQIEEGAKFFDIRVRLDDKNNFIACHGLVEYKVNVLTAINKIESSGCYYRVVLENKVGGKNVDTEKQLSIVRELFLTKEFSHCVYICDKKSFNKEYNPNCDFKPAREYTKHYASNKPFVPKKKVKQYISDKYKHSLNLDKENLYYYDFVDIK